MADIVFAAHAAVVRTVQGPFNAVELKAQACTMPGFDTGTQMLQQRLDIAPVNVSADRLLKNGAQDTLVFVAHTMLGLTGPYPLTEMLCAHCRASSCRVQERAFALLRHAEQRHHLARFARCAHLLCQHPGGTDRGGLDAAGQIRDQ